MLWCTLNTKFVHDIRLVGNGHPTMMSTIRRVFVGCVAQIAVRQFRSIAEQRLQLARHIDASGWLETAITPESAKTHRQTLTAMSGLYKCSMIAARSVQHSANRLK